MKEIFGIPERERKPNVEHHRQADDLRAGLEVLKGAGLVVSEQCEQISGLA
jgi:hypothetical protein